MYLMYLMYLVPELPVVPVVPENLISDMLVSPPFQKYITPMLNIENITPMVNIENGEIETPATLFRYLYYLLYLVPGTWYLVPGTWYLVPGTWYLKYLWYLLHIKT